MPRLLKRLNWTNSLPMCGRKKRSLRHRRRLPPQWADRGAQVSQDRSLTTLQAVVDSLPPARRYTSDGHATYAELVWTEGAEHGVSVGMEETSTIESFHAHLRTYLKRLARRSRCFSRSLEALRRAVRLFVYDYNHRQRLYPAHPSLRGCSPLLI